MNNDDDDAKLFRQTVGPCKEMVDDHIEPWLARPRAQRRQREHEPEWSFPGMTVPAATGRPRRSTPRSLLRRLSRGKIPIQAQLDLHGLTAEQAGEALAHFIHHQRDIHARCLLIIHGKGLRSANRRPVLGQLVRHWLDQHPAVTTYCQARPADGGTGAVYVLLKGERPRTQDR